MGAIEVGDEFVLTQSAAFAFDITESFGEVGPTGDIQATVEIDGVPVVGLSGATYDTQPTGYSATSGNNASTGQKVTVVVTGITLDPDDFAFTITTERLGGGGSGLLQGKTGATGATGETAEAYTPGDPSGWQDSDPTTIFEALDRLNAAVRAGETGPVA